jgi:phosphatidylinositol alpha 1,6-mannosyltransferase
MAPRGPPAVRRGYAATAAGRNAYAAAYGASWMRAPVERYVGRFHRRSQRTYTPSGPARDDLRRLGVPDVEVWGRGVDGEVFNSRHRSAEWRTRLELGDRFTFLHVGRLASEKRVDQIVTAYGEVLSRVPRDSTRLVIAGAGPREATLRAAAPPGTTFLGPARPARAEVPLARS